jgi:hypothetical protein
MTLARRTQGLLSNPERCVAPDLFVPELRGSANETVNQIPNNRTNLYGFDITPQAMRSPAFPAGSVFMSSALAWITSAVPPLLKMEWLSLGVHREVLHVASMMAFRVFKSVLFAIGIEMRPG